MLVLTPDVFRIILDRAFIQMKDVNVIVFDEAHHARGNHPYKVIMDLHYINCPLEQRPKIFGMTASPLSARENTDESVK